MARPTDSSQRRPTGNAGLPVGPRSSQAKRLRNLRDRVAAVIDTVRPMAQRDGGDIELVDVDLDGVVTVRLHGACVGCPSSALTLTMGIERNLKDQIPEVTRVVCA